MAGLFHKSLIRVAFMAALAFASLSARPRQGSSTKPPDPSPQEIELPGLRAPVSILVDRWGVSHIFAANEDDLFFAQGFNAARDRLFQIDLWRRRGLGRLAEVLGPAFAEQDRASRLFLYRGEMDREWRAYSSRGTMEAARITGAFAAGINARIDYLRAHPEELPWEFRKLGYEPARWSAEDVVRIRSHGLTRNLLSEVARARTACIAGLRADGIRAGSSRPGTRVFRTGWIPACRTACSGFFSWPRLRCASPAIRRWSRRAE